MILRQLKVALVLVAVLMTLSIGAKAVGALQPPNPALRGFIEGCEGQPQPCWYGIVPGISTAREAQSRLETAGYKLVSTEILSSYITDCQAITCCKQVDAHTGATVTRMDFSQCSDVFLGDLMAMFGYSITPLAGYPGVYSLRDSRVIFIPYLDDLTLYNPIVYFSIEQ